MENPEKVEGERKRLSKTFPQKAALANTGLYILYSLL